MISANHWPAGAASCAANACATRAQSFGIEFEWLSPRDIAARLPQLRTDDLAGGVWIPGDGKANPTDLTQSLAKGARNGGAKIFESTRVTGVQAHNGRVAGVEWQAGDERGRITCEFVVNCAGQWAREFGEKAGVAVPLQSAEHFYIVTEPIAGVTPAMPVVRDPDGFIYFKEEVGGVVMGGFEPVAKPWNVDPIPPRFEFRLLDEDWQQFEPLMENAIRRIDRETRELLGATFESVNRHFGEMFPSLFGGGNAKLGLTGDEILDAGIQVIAQPPGKRNSSIHLLSGAGRVPFATYMAGTVIGLIPMIAVLSGLGGLLRQTLLNPSRSNVLIAIGASTILFVVASGLRTFLLIRQFAPAISSHRGRAEFG